MPFYIKYADSDVPVPPAGVARPIPAGTPFWLSPSIWMQGPGGTKRNFATEDELQDLRVVVHDGGLGQPQIPDANIAVQVWVSDFTLGVGPSGVHTGQSIPPEGLEDLTLDSLPPNARMAKFDWTPIQGDFFNVSPAGTAHMCIGANSYIDGGENGPKIVPPPSTSLDVRGNQHHGQLNITILDAGDGAAMAIMTVPNTEEEAAVFRIEAHRVKGRLQMIEREHLLALPHVRRVGGKPFDPKKFRDRELGEPIERLELRHGGELAVGRDKTPLHRAKRGLKQFALEGPDGRGDRELELELPPQDPDAKPVMVRAHLQLADPGDIGAVELLDVVQRRRDGELVGGARIVMLNARPRDLQSWQESADR